jgi:signal transduction histidine kinase
MDVVEMIRKDILLSPAQGFHLYRIAQEAINNAVKHSKADQVTVTIESAETWKLSVEDNGKGMSQKKEISEECNGLLNMKSRAETSGWNIKWVNASGKGVRVDVSPSTTN